MTLGARASGTFAFGQLTATAGTIIRRTIAPKPGRKPVITKAVYTNSTTAHTLTCMQSLAQTTVASAAAAGQAVVNFTADPGSIAANDVCVIQKPDGTYETMQVSSVATLAITMTTNVPTGGFAAGAKIHFMGVAADHSANGQLTLPVSVTTTYSDAEGGVFGGAVDAPLVVESNNATAAGTLLQLTGVYVNA